MERYDGIFIVKHDSERDEVELQLAAMNTRGEKLLVITKNQAQSVCINGSIVMRDVRPDFNEAIYLDHAGNVARHGFAEDVVPDCLDSGDKDYDEKELIKKEKEAKPIECECCHAIMKGLRCLSCGHELKTKRRELETVAGELTEVVRFTPQMQEFYSGLLHYAREKGKADGWAYHTYKEKYKRPPTEAKKVTMAPNAEVLGFIKHKNIKYAKSKFRANRARDTAMREMGL